MKTHDHANDLAAALAPLVDDYLSLLHEHGKPFRWGKLTAENAAAALDRWTKHNATQPQQQTALDL